MESNFKKTIIGFSGGLGNQMFNYAIGLSLSLKFKSKFIIDNSFYKSSENIFNESFKLNHFHINKDIEVTNNYNDLFFKTVKISRKLKFTLPFNLKILKLFLQKTPDQIILEKNFQYDKKLFDHPLKNNTYYFGYWQSFFYFDHIKKTLFKDFEQFNIRQDLIAKVLKKISSNTVAVHIRGGDMEDDNLMEYVPISYYKNGIKFFNKNFSSDINFHIFTDDIPYAKEQAKKIFTNNEKILFIKDFELTDLEEFNLLRYYSSYLLARSTFSWWASYLCYNKTKTVILPSIWFKNQKTPIDRLAENMITIPDE